ncbi:hypothetical protein ACFLQP_02620 [Acidobacteriota bacterium]
MKGTDDRGRMTAVNAGVGTRFIAYAAKTEKTNQEANHAENDVRW